MGTDFVLRFVVRIVGAAVLFAVVAAVAYVLWLGTEWLHINGPQYLYIGSAAVTGLLFALDIICFLVFVIAEAYKFIREIIISIW
jgi:hypothetical protein